MNNTTCTSSSRGNHSLAISPSTMSMVYVTVSLPTDARSTSAKRGLISPLSSRGLTSGEISAHSAEACGASVPEDSITRITDTVLEEMAAWWPGPLERVYAAIFIDVITGKSVTGRSARSRSMPRSRSTSMAARTSWR